MGLLLLLLLLGIPRHGAGPRRPKDCGCILYTPGRRAREPKARPVGQARRTRHVCCDIPSVPPPWPLSTDNLTSSGARE
eukprot:2810574-Prymnesium_polylepis.1